MNYGNKYGDLLYRPEVDKSRYETLPYNPQVNPPRYQTLPYYPEREDRSSQGVTDSLLGQMFLEEFLQQNPAVIESAGMSFDMPVDIDSPVIDRDIERYRQSPGYKPLDMDKFYRNLERVRQMLRGV